MFIPATLKSELKKNYEAEIKKAEVKLRGVERSGRSLKSNLQKSDHLGPRSVQTSIGACFALQKVKEDAGSVTYKIDCAKCRDV